MSKKKNIEKTFAFLLEQGFEYSEVASEVTLFIYRFTNKKTVVSFYGDYTNEFVEMKIKDGNKILLEISNEGVMINDVFIGYDEMQKSLNMLQACLLKEKKTIYEDQFSFIIGVYSDFIKLNLHKLIK